MFYRAVKAAALAVAAFGLSAAANAATVFNFSFTAPWSAITGGSTATASGQLFANANSNGTYSVYGVAGTAKLTTTSTPVTLDTATAYGLNGTPTISLNSSGVYSVNAIELAGGGTTFDLTRNLFNTSTYTITSGLRSASAGTFTLALATPAAVPEAATWMMMILGFGAVGAALRTGRRQSIVHLAA